MMHMVLGLPTFGKDQADTLKVKDATQEEVMLDLGHARRSLGL
jgi:hypothetical protein